MMAQLPLFHALPARLLFEQPCGLYNDNGGNQYFNDECTQQASILAIQFCMGHYNKDDKVAAQLVGFDCPFDDSPLLYGCPTHMVDLVAQAREYDEFHPEIVIDPRGEIVRKVWQEVSLSCFGESLEADPLQRPYSQARETLKVFWQRERWRWV